QVEIASEVVPEIIPNERILAAEQRASIPPWSIELRVPRMRADPDIAPARGQGCRVELHAGVHAVIQGAIRRRNGSAAQTWIDRIERQTGAGRFRCAGRRACHSSVIEVHAYRAIGRGGQVWLKLVNVDVRVVIDLDRRGPVQAAVKRTREK